MLSVKQLVDDCSFSLGFGLARALVSESNSFLPALNGHLPELFGQWVVM
jgi:hypothetical protein